MRIVARTRSGFTLVETVLVVAILVIVGAIAIPVTQTLLLDMRIVAAGDMVRARLADARSKALEQGRPWKLACIANTGVFQLAPEEASDWDSADQQPQQKMELIRDHLPTDIIFATSESDIAGSKDQLPASGRWETIAVYLPEGGARDDTILYFGKTGLMPMRVRVRGLTGVATVEMAIAPREDQP
jgi:prepilin-type N-terminal cleavage/methylation domain-containing protein